MNRLEEFRITFKSDQLFSQFNTIDMNIMINMNDGSTVFNDSIIYNNSHNERFVYLTYFFSGLAIAVFSISVY